MALINQVRILKEIISFKPEGTQGNTYGSKTATVIVAIIAARAGITKRALS